MGNWKTVKRGTHAVAEGAFWGAVAVGVLGLFLLGVAVAVGTAESWVEWVITGGVAAYFGGKAGIYQWRHG